MSCDTQVVERLSDLVSSFICHSAGHLPDDVKTRLAQMKEEETEGFAPSIYDVMEKNMKMADELGRPSCQDTGLPQFFAKQFFLVEVKRNDPHGFFLAGPIQPCVQILHCLHDQSHFEQVGFTRSNLVLPEETAVR